MNSTLHFNTSLNQENPFQAVLDAKKYQFTATRENKPFQQEKISFAYDRLWYFTWVILFGIGLVIIKPWQKSTNEQFGFSNTEIAQKLEDSTNENVAKAIYALNNKDLYTAKLLLGKQYAQNPDNAKLAYNYALVLFGDNKTKIIKEILTPIAQGSSIYKAKASLMLALCYMKEKSISMSKQWLLQVPKNSTSYAQAQQLFSELDKV